MKPTITPEEMARYRAGAQARESARRQGIERRREVAWELAHRAARMLREEFGATRVVVFGSLARAAWFHARSDIDLAVAGIPPEAFWRAGSALDHLDPTFEFDLIALEDAPASLKEEIAQGAEL